MEMFYLHFIEEVLVVIPIRILISYRTPCDPYTCQFDVCMTFHSKVQNLACMTNV